MKRWRSYNKKSIKIRAFISFKPANDSGTILTSNAKGKPQWTLHKDEVMKWVSAKESLPDAKQYPYAKPLLVIARDPKDTESEHLYFYMLAFRHGDRFICDDSEGKTFMPDIKFWCAIPDKPKDNE